MQELKPVYIHETSYSTEDEISFIDLAITLVKRKNLIYLITIGFIILGIATALLIPKKYTYSTSLEIGSQIINGSVKSFESPQTLLAKLKHSFIPQTLSEHRLSNPADEKKYEIKASVPKSSVIVVLEVKDTEEHGALMKNLLQSITQKITLDHSRIFESVKRSLLSQLERDKIKLAHLGSGADNLAEKTSLQSNIEGYSTQLANLRSTHDMSPPMKSLESGGTSRKLIVIIAAFTGLFIAVFSAFFAEFVSKIQERKDEIINQ